MTLVVKKFLKIALFAYAGLVSMTVNGQIEVLNSIRPLQLITAAITDGVSEPRVVLELQQDPHHGALKPSQRRALAEAELILWIGPSMEKALSKVIQDLDAKIISLAEIEDIQTLSLREGLDPHLWLSTENALEIAKALTQVLSEMDSQNRSQYENNLSTFEQALRDLNRQIKSKISAQANLNFGVYHNAFQYYEQQFGLEHLVSFTDDEELKPGIRKILSIRKTLEETKTGCLIVEPSNNIDELSSAIEIDDMKYVSIDVLGTNIPLGKNSYIHLMSQLTDNLIQCLR